MSSLLRSVWLLLFACLSVFASSAHAQAPATPAALSEYKLGPGDQIRVQVFQNPDLTVEARVSEAGAISYPLVGSVAVGGMTIGQAEAKIATALRNGNF